MHWAWSLHPDLWDTFCYKFSSSLKAEGNDVKVVHERPMQITKELTLPAHGRTDETEIFL